MPLEAVRPSATFSMLKDILKNLETGNRREQWVKNYILNLSKRELEYKYDHRAITSSPVYWSNNIDSPWKLYMSTGGTDAAS